MQSPGTWVVQVRKKALKQGVELKFFSRRDHLDASLREYRVSPPV